MTSQHFTFDPLDEDFIESPASRALSSGSRPTPTALAPRVGLVGSTAETLLSEVLKEIAQWELSGDLQIVSGRAKRTLYFDRGFIVFAGSNLKRDRLGQRLLASGRLTAEELDSAFRLTKHDKPLGRALVEAGLLSEEELEREVTRQAKRIALTAYVIQEAAYSFDERPCIIPLELRLGISVYRIQLEGIRRMANGHLIHRALGSLDRAVRAVEVPPFRLKPPELRDLERRVLELAAEPTSLRQIVARSDESVDDVLRAAYGLVCAHVVECEELEQGRRELPNASRKFLLSELEETRLSAPAKVRQEVLLQFDSLGEASAEALLNVDPSADAETIEQAYEKRREEWEKKQALLTQEKSLFLKVEEIQRRLAEAHLHLLEEKSDAQHEGQERLDSAGGGLDAIEIPMGEEIEIPIEDEEDIAIEFEDEELRQIAAAEDDVVVEPEPSPQELYLESAPLDTELGDWDAEASETPAEPGDDKPLIDSAGEATSRGVRSPDGPGSPRDRLRQLLYDIKIRKAVNDREGAISLLYEVVELMPNTAKYEAMLADALASHPALSQRAEGHYRRAISLDPQNAGLHYRLGRYYEAFNMRSRALGEYKTTLRIDPRHKKARAALAGGNGKKAGAAGKLFKRLFG